MVGRLNPNTLQFSLFAADGPDRMGEIDAYDNCQIVARFNEVSTWQLVAPTDTPGAQLLLSAENPRLVVSTSPAVVFRSGPLIRTEREVGSDGDLTTFTGVDDLIYLRWRLAHPQPGSAAPPYSTQAFDTRTGATSVVMAEFVDHNAGPSAVADRRIPGLTVPVPVDMGIETTVSARYQNLLTMLQRMAWRARLGIEIRDLVFYVFDPVGPTAVFSADLGTLGGWTEAREGAGGQLRVRGRWGAGGQPDHQRIRRRRFGDRVGADRRVRRPPGHGRHRRTRPGGRRGVGGCPRPRAAAGGVGHPLPTVHHRLAVG